MARSSREAIAVVLDHFWFSPDMERIGESVAECVANATARKTSDMRVFSPADFRNAVFPGFDAAAVPCTPETLWLLLDHQEFRSRLESHGIRYLVLLRGGTKATRYGGFDCAVGFGAGGCFGVFWWDKTTVLETTIMDTRKGTVINGITATAHGTPWVAVILVAPVGIPVSTEYPACEAIGETIASHLSSGTSGQAANEPQDPAQGMKK